MQLKAAARTSKNILEIEIKWIKMFSSNSDSVHAV